MSAQLRNELVQHLQDGPWSSAAARWYDAIVERSEALTFTLTLTHINKNITPDLCQASRKTLNHLSLFKGCIFLHYSSINHSLTFVLKKAC